MSQRQRRTSPLGLPSPPTTGETCTALERLSKAMAEACNAENRTGIRDHWTTKYFAEDFHSEPAYRSTSQSHEENFQSLHEFLHRHPLYHATVTQTTGHVNLRAGYADVYMHIVSRGLPEGVVRQSVAVNEFRLREGRWVCVKYTAMRGHPSIYLPDNGTARGEDEDGV